MLVNSPKKSVTPEDERQWVAAAKKDPAQFRHLFNAYHDMIFNYILRRIGDAITAQDLTSNTFLKALDNIGKFQWQGVGFSAWLYRIATNEVNLYFRSNRRMVPISQEIRRTLKTDTASDEELLKAEERVLQNQKFRQMHQAISQLDSKYQNVLTLRYFEEKSTKEVADILDISENTVKTHTRRGLMKLRELL